jgi:hypothetical protein
LEEKNANTRSSPGMSVGMRSGIFADGSSGKGAKRFSGEAGGVYVRFGMGRATSHVGGL